MGDEPVCPLGDAMVVGCLFCDELNLMSRRREQGLASRALGPEVQRFTAVAGYFCYQHAKSQYQKFPDSHHHYHNISLRHVHI